MSLLPVPRAEEWDHIGIAEAHAVAMSADTDDDTRLTALLRLLRLSVLQQERGRADRLAADVDRLAGVTGDRGLARMAAAERLRLRLRDMRVPADAEAVQAEGLRLLAECPDDDLAARARVLFCLGNSAAWTADPALFARAVDWLGEAVGLLRVLDERELQAEALLALGYLAYPNQRLYSRAIAALERSVALLIPSSSPFGVHLSYLAECRVITGDLDRAEGELREAHAIGVRTGDHRLIGYAAWELARIADLQADAATCDRWIAEAQRHPGDWFEGKAGNEFVADTVLWAFRQNRPHIARARWEALAARGERIAGEQADGARGLIALQEGRFAEAAADIDGHLRAGWQEPRLWHWQILLADAELSAGHRERAAETVRAVRHELASIGATDLAERFEPDRWGRLTALDTTAEPRVSLRLLGAPAAIVDGRERRLPDGHPAVLVGLLAVAGRDLSLDEACDALWPDSDPALARRRLRNVVARVRRVAPVVERSAVGLRLSVGVEVDCLVFERAARSAERDQGLDHRAALARYRGPFLAGSANERVEAHRRRFAALAETLRRALIAASLAAGDPATAAADAEALLSLNPFDEDTAWAVARGFARAGDGVSARAWEERARQIAAELDV